MLGQLSLPPRGFGFGLSIPNTTDLAGVDLAAQIVTLPSLRLSRSVVDAVGF